MLHEIPKFQPAEKIGVRIGPLHLSVVGFLWAVGRAFPRILNLERRRNDEDIRDAVLSAGFENHPPDPRIDWQEGQLAAQRSQPAAVVDGTQFEERLEAVADCLGPRRIEERELVNRTEI